MFGFGKKQQPSAPQQTTPSAPASSAPAPAPPVVSLPTAKTPAPARNTTPETMQLKIIATPGTTNELVTTNCVYVSIGTFGCMKEEGDEVPVYVKVNNECVFICRGSSKVEADCIALNSIQRRACRASLGTILTVSKYVPPVKNFLLSSITVEIDYIRKPAYDSPVDGEALSEHIKAFYNNQILRLDQQWVTEFEGVGLTLTVADLEVIDSLVKGEDQKETASMQPTMGMINPQTIVIPAKNPKSTIKLTNMQSKSATTILNPKFNFENLGIGGLDKEFSSIFRRAFASRIFPTSVIEKLGINHVKGILLYGPPGTGKTLMARQIGKMLNCKDVQVVNGPEILNKYVGQSEENIRNLFAKAEKEAKERGNDSELHLLIFDELDAICRQRGSVGGSTGVHDSVVNQLLSKIDGVNALNNVLIIGMTNRRDLIDDALLRPGRFEVQIEIGLPDEHGRLQILNIHTKKMRDHKYLGDDVNLEEIAEVTKNFSGAELEGLVKSATSFAFNRQVDANNVNKPIDANNIKITMADFRRALQEVKPAFGVQTDQFEAYTKEGLIYYGPEFSSLVDTCRSFIKQVQTGGRTNLLSVLLEGEFGSGKTALAATLAVQSGFPYVKIISPETMVGYSEAAKCHAITKVFDDSYKSPLSVIVLDNIERLVEYVHMGPRFSNTVLQTLLVLLKKVPPKGRKLLILGTTSVASVLESIEVVDTFNVKLLVPELNNPESIRRVLIDSGAFPESQAADENSDLNQAIAVLPRKVPIKKLLLIAEMALSRAEGSNVTFEIFQACIRDCQL